MYLSEISSPNIRGALGTLHQLGVVVGILVSQVLGFPEILGNSDYWNLLLGVLYYHTLNDKTNLVLLNSGISSI